MIEIIAMSLFDLDQGIEQIYRDYRMPDRVHQPVPEPEVVVQFLIRSPLLDWTDMVGLHCLFFLTAGGESYE